MGETPDPGPRARTVGTLVWLAPVAMTGALAVGVWASVRERDWGQLAWVLSNAFWLVAWIAWVRLWVAAMRLLERERARSARLLNQLMGRYLN